MQTNDAVLQQEWVDNKRKEAKNIFKMRMITIISVIVFLIIWQAIVDLGIANSRTLPAPLKICDSFVKKMSTKAPDGNLLPTNILASLQVSLLGFVSAVVLGVPLGLLMGWYKGMNRFCTPLFEFLRPIPPIAWIPIVVMWMGIGLRAKVVIIFFSAFVPCVINSYTGIRMANQTLINVSKTFGAKNFEIFYKIGVPSSLPMVMAGVRLALGNSWSTLVAAEMLAASSGLGFMIQMGRQLARADIVVLGMVLIGILGAIMSAIFTAIENHLLRWKIKN